MKKIAIVNSSSFGQHFPEHIKRLEKIGEVKHHNFPIDVTGKEIAAAIGDVDYIIASVTPKFTAEYFNYAKNLKLISRHGIGYNNVDVDAADKHHVYVSIVDGIVEQDAVAENAVALLLAVARRVVESSEAAKAGRWSDRSQFMGYQIRGKTTGIIGMGNIGSRVASIMANGFRNEVLAYDPNLSAAEIRLRGAEPVSLETLVQQSDFISLNAYLNPSSYHMINDQMLHAMKRSAIIANSARGELVDMTALQRALEAGSIAGYGADVAEGEPVGSDYPLFAYRNVVLSPHTSAYTWECLKGMGDKCVDDVERVDRGLAPGKQRE